MKYLLLMIVSTSAWAFDVSQVTLENLPEIENPYLDEYFVAQGKDIDIEREYLRFETCQNMVISRYSALIDMQGRTSRGESKEEIIARYTKPYVELGLENIESDGTSLADMKVIEIAFEYKDRHDDFPSAAMAQCLVMNKELFL
ncbi:hypothetical protein [Pleionea litopenaei]|uniref:Uncharacterized protein n=1 Tax=Pleionea litopenaei TaxID=3070815 RepID=A0AA51RTL0_9GAMM|nr:hypothetical protein [Pleionea sp. HL-JVS1]WMS87239.1 hypothetical protein Q9312_18700 [Pleionea sp. HL-JVS1]